MTRSGKIRLRSQGTYNCINPRTMRRKFRTEKADLKLLEAECKSVQDQHSLSISILPKSSLDDEIAGMIRFGKDDQDVNGLLQKKEEAVFKAKKKSKISSQELVVGTPTRDSRHGNSKGSVSSKSTTKDAKSKLMGLVQKSRRGDPFGNF